MACSIYRLIGRKKKKERERESKVAPVLN